MSPLYNKNFFIKYNSYFMQGSINTFPSIVVLSNRAHRSINLLLNHNAKKNADCKPKFCCCYLGLFEGNFMQKRSPEV